MIMIQQTAQAEKFKQQLRESLQRDSLNSHAVKVARHANVYTVWRSRREHLLY
jgi:hypothetical protein